MTTIQIRRDTAANWASVNPVLAAGEMGYDSTNHLIKIGDGTTAWNSLTTEFRRSPVFKVKPTSTTRNSTTTRTDDPHLVIPVKSGRAYFVEVGLLFNAAATPDANWTIAVPGSSTLWLSSAHSANAQSQVLPATQNGVADDRGIRLWGTFVAGGDGNISVSWAQATSNASDTTLKAGSFLAVWEAA